MSAFAASNNSNKGSEFEAQRSELLREIALGMESVLQSINRLNRNLESIIAVGNEFGSVEALWSQFENVMGTEESNQGLQQQQQQQQEDDQLGDEDVKREEDEEDGVVEGTKAEDEDR